jgi:hypothetical protein
MCILLLTVVSNNVSVTLMRSLRSEGSMATTTTLQCTMIHTTNTMLKRYGVGRLRNTKNP